MSYRPKGSIFGGGGEHRRRTSPAGTERRRTTMYSQGIIKVGRDSTENVPITVKACQQSNEHGVPFKKLAIAKEKLPSFPYQIETAQKWLTLEGKEGRVHKFPLRTILPKVQMTKHVAPKKLPRDVEVDRRRRKFSKVNMEEELEKAALTAEELMPTEDQYYILSENAFKHFLPISFFDDSNFDCHSPEAWLKLGEVEDDEDSPYPLPVKAFLPIQQSLTKYKWQYAAVSDYNHKTGKWIVMDLADEFVYEVPKVQLMFLAESPLQFVERLKRAIRRRNKAETLIMMETIVDCVLLQDLKENHYYPNKLVDRLMKDVQTDPVFYKQLRTEIYLVQEHLMACYEFDKFVKILPKEFPKFTGDIIKKSLPKAFYSLQSEKEKQLLKSMAINISQRKYQVLSYSLNYTKGGIESMANVAYECLHVETLTIFICNLTKAMPLSDFLISQQQQSTHVANYLKNLWPVKLSSGIIMVLRALGKGWLDIGLDKWSVYSMCKIFRFILQVKFRMQESMQVLLEKSIHHFTQFLSEPCRKFLELNENYEWKSDFIHSEFPYSKAIFSLIITVTEDKEVVYSNQPEEFAPALKEIFKKSLEKTNGVRCIDAETLTNLRFAPNLYILTVELIEDLYVRCNDLLMRCYEKAVLPLRSYAHKFDRFIDFYLLNVSAYMNQYRASEKPSMQVKKDILEHKRCKEEMREILPPTITIGPFLVIVDPMKQYMIRKRIEIVKRIFEYYLDRMYDTNERLLERCLEIYTKINEKPQSIEHLYDIRNFALNIPELVDQLRADIQIMWIEYDMLDSFFYNLPDHQFAMKWEVYAGPKKILDRLSTLKEEQKIDIEEFKRLHLSECIGFEERLESLNDEIQQFSLQFNPHKVMETAVEVSRVEK